MPARRRFLYSEVKTAFLAFETKRMRRKGTQNETSEHSNGRFMKGAAFKDGNVNLALDV